MNRSHTDTSRPPAPALIAAFLCAALSAFGAGCNIVGPVMVLASGPPSTPALFELDADKNHVIFIDDFRNRMPRRSLRFEMAQSAESELMTRKSLREARLISNRAASRVASEESASERLSIADIGKQVGADVVIYVIIDSWFITRDYQTASPAVISRVKIIDVAQNRRIWPANAEGYTLSVQPKALQGDMPANLAARSALEQRLAQQFGIALAQMFYKYENRQSARD